MRQAGPAYARGGSGALLASGLSLGEDPLIGGIGLRLKASHSV